MRNVCERYAGTELPVGCGLDTAALVRQAREAGVVLRVEGDRLRLRGPRSAEPFMRELLARKGEVLAVLASEPTWDEGAAGAVVARCRALVEQARSAGGLDTAAREGLADLALDIVRRYQLAHDPHLWDCQMELDGLLQSFRH
jgi:hypothetical protein